MKKIMLSAAIVLGSLTAFATTTNLSTVTSIEVRQDEYKEIKAEEVPEAVKSTIEKSFPGAKLVRASVNDNAEYKLDISVAENNYTVFSDAQGNIIKK